MIAPSIILAIRMVLGFQSTTYVEQTGSDENPDQQCDVLICHFERRLLFLSGVWFLGFFGLFLLFRVLAIHLYTRNEVRATYGQGGRGRHVLVSLLPSMKVWYQSGGLMFSRSKNMSKTIS